LSILSVNQFIQICQDVKTGHTKRILSFNKKKTGVFSYIYCINGGLLCVIENLFLV